MGKRYRPECKQEAVSLVVTQGFSVTQAAADLGSGCSTLDHWLRRHPEHKHDPNVVGETELAARKRLRKEVHLRRLERAVRKKPTRYVAKDRAGGSRS